MLIISATPKDRGKCIFWVPVFLSLHYNLCFSHCEKDLKDRKRQF